MRDDAAMVKLLILHNADVNPADGSGRTPLHIAVMCVSAAERPRGYPRGRSAAAQARPSAVARGGACRGEFACTVGHHPSSLRNGRRSTPHDEAKR